MEKTSWKKIPGFADKYLISSKGEIIEVDTGRYLKIRLKPDGYCWLTLNKNGKYKNFYIHRLLAETFIPKRDGKNQVNHKNGNKSDNRIENLEWVDSKENQWHRVYVLGKNKGCYPMKNIYCVELNKTFRSVGEAGRQTGVNPNCIAKVARGNTPNKTAGGYHWRYII